VLFYRGAQQRRPSQETRPVLPTQPSPARVESSRTGHGDKAGGSSRLHRLGSQLSAKQNEAKRTRDTQTTPTPPPPPPSPSKQLEASRRPASCT
ncbi:unnamed protein product, partial [Laminaria digitata]